MGRLSSVKNMVVPWSKFRVHTVVISIQRDESVTNDREAKIAANLLLHDWKASSYDGKIKIYKPFLLWKAYETTRESISVMLKEQRDR